MGFKMVEFDKKKVDNIRKELLKTLNNHQKGLLFDYEISKLELKLNEALK